MDLGVELCTWAPYKYYSHFPAAKCASCVRRWYQKRTCFVDTSSSDTAGELNLALACNSFFYCGKLLLAVFLSIVQSHCDHPYSVGHAAMADA